MGYRLENPKPHVPRRNLVDMTTPVKLHVSNGTLTHFAFPCWYQEIYPPVPAEIHDRMMHDHYGWPNPDNADHSCQLWIPEYGHDIHYGWPNHRMQECYPHCSHFIDFERTFPIHLLSEYEGYTDASVAWVEEEPDLILVEAHIDPVEDWVVRVDMDIADKDAVFHPRVYHFSVYVNSPERRDLVVLAELIVHPSALPEESSDTITS